MYADFVAQIACKSALTVLLLGRRVFASQRVPVCLPATLVDSSSFCFATCVCQSACDSGRLGSTRSCVDRRSELVEPANRSQVSRKALAKSTPKRFAKQLAETQKSTSGGPKIHSGRVQNRAKIAQDAPRIPRSIPRASQERPKTPQERPKSAPERPKTAQEPPKSGPRATQERRRAD